MKPGFGFGGTSTTSAGGGGLFGSTNTGGSLFSTPTGTATAFGSGTGSVFGQNKSGISRYYCFDPSVSSNLQQLLHQAVHVGASFYSSEGYLLHK